HPPIALKTLDRSHCQYPSRDPEGIVVQAKSLAGLAKRDPKDRRISAIPKGSSPEPNPVRDLLQWNWHKKTSFSRSVRGRG
ncbi:hypothetical protein, partial [Mesorhizobium sp. B2-6-2]|uniref:hypothetical protein n=1 Tax=Mesorhizobium sp. B2-6-2 TaxID=2589915 RepID=UPI001AEDB19E